MSYTVDNYSIGVQYDTKEAKMVFVDGEINFLVPEYSEFKIVVRKIRSGNSELKISVDDIPVKVDDIGYINRVDAKVLRINTLGGKNQYEVNLTGNSFSYTFYIKPSADLGSRLPIKSFI